MTEAMATGHVEVILRQERNIRRMQQIAAGRLFQRAVMQQLKYIMCSRRHPVDDLRT